MRCLLIEIRAKDKWRNVWALQKCKARVDIEAI